jgi:hypothetical protein
MVRGVSTRPKRVRLPLDPVPSGRPALSGCALTKLEFRAGVALASSWEFCGPPVLLGQREKGIWDGQALGGMLDFRHEHDDSGTGRRVA